MRCATPDRVRRIAEKQQKQMISDTSRWSIITTVWILFDKFKWSKERVEYFLRRYDEQTDMIAPQRERYVPYDDRTKPGYTFDEIHEEVGLDIKLKNSRQSGNKVEQTIGNLQDHCIRWILDVILNTLRNKCGWGDTMCRRFASYYNTAIPQLSEPTQNYERIKKDLFDKYGFKFEVTVK